VQAVLDFVGVRQRPPLLPANGAASPCRRPDAPTASRRRGPRPTYRELPGAGLWSHPGAIQVDRNDGRARRRITRFQPRLKAGAQRMLEGIDCKPLLGKALPATREPVDKRIEQNQLD
jgi:hypothetical protein